MEDPFAELKSLAGQKAKSDVHLLQGFRALDARFSEALEGAEVYGVSKYCTVEEMPEVDYVLLARLCFAEGRLCVQTNSSEDNHLDFGDYREEIAMGPTIRTKSLEECKPGWLRTLATSDVLDSLFANLAQGLQKDIAPSKEGMQALTTAMNLPIRNIEIDIERLSKQLDYTAVSSNWKKAQDVTGSDPADAATRASQMLETLFKHILSDLGEKLPPKQSIHPLYKAVRDRVLKLDHKQPSPYVVKMLSGLTTIVQSIGELRTHTGTAHGRSPGETPIDSQQARLAVGAAGITARFFLENVEVQKQVHDEKG